MELKRISPGVVAVNLSEDSTEVCAQLDKLNVKYVHLLYGNYRVLRGETIIKAALGDEEVRSWLVELAIRGFYLYMTNVEGSRFCHEDRLPFLWQQHTRGDLELSDHGIFYSIVGRERTRRPRNVFVVFSAMGNDMFTPSLSRFYVRNYQHLYSAIGGDSWLVRIPDVGGVLGAFYLPTRFNRGSAVNIQKLFRSILDAAQLPPERMVMVGSSKGGTGASYHSLEIGSSLISIDPILEDSYYENSRADCHFTAGGVFLEDKRSVFGRIASSANERDEAYRVVLTSESSPQFPVVKEFFNRTSIPILTCNDRSISDHPDVAKVTHRIVMSLATSFVSGLPLPFGDQLVS